MLLSYRIMFLVMGIISIVLSAYFIEGENSSFFNESEDQDKGKLKEISRVFRVGFAFIAGVSGIGFVLTFIKREESIEFLMNNYFLGIIFIILIMSMFVTRLRHGKEDYDKK